MIQNASPEHSSQICPYVTWGTSDHMENTEPVGGERTTQEPEQTQPNCSIRA